MILKCTSLIYECFNKRISIKVWPKNISLNINKTFHRPRVYNAELLFHHQRPLIVERRGQQVDINGKICNQSRLRLVYYCYRDVSEYPTFTKRLTDQRVTSGRTTSLAVEITGFPTPTVQWLKDGQPLKESENREVSCRICISISRYPNNNNP